MSSREWQSWSEVPLVLKTGQVVELLGLDRRTLDKLARAGHLRRGLVAGSYRYGRAALREFTRRAGCDPFSV